MNITKRPEFIRAKIVDEPFVRTTLEEFWGNKYIHYSLGTPEEDWQHIDIKQTDSRDVNNVVFYDVKRNSSKDINTPNFLFMFKNANGNLFNYVHNGYFAYIDDATGDIIIISHMKMQEYVNTYNHIKTKFGNKSEYILIPKKTMRNDAYCVFKGNPTKIKYLAITSDYSNYMNFYNH